MALYTPLSIHDIFPDDSKPHKIISYQGKTVVAEQLENQQLQLVQLISTNPQDYLDGSLHPGTILKNDYIHD